MALLRLVAAGGVASRFAAGRTLTSPSRGCGFSWLEGAEGVLPPAIVPGLGWLKLELLEAGIPIGAELFAGAEPPLPGSDRDAREPSPGKGFWEGFCVRLPASELGDAGMPMGLLLPVVLSDAKPPREGAGACGLPKAGLEGKPLLAPRLAADLGGVVCCRVGTLPGVGVNAPPVPLAAKVSGEVPGSPSSDDRAGVGRGVRSRSLAMFPSSTVERPSPLLLGKGVFSRSANELPGAGGKLAIPAPGLVLIPGSLVGATVEWAPGPSGAGVCVKGSGREPAAGGGFSIPAKGSVSAESERPGDGIVPGSCLGAGSVFKLPGTSGLGMGAPTNESFGLASKGESGRSVLGRPVLGRPVFGRPGSGKPVSPLPGFAAPLGCGAGLLGFVRARTLLVLPFLFIEPKGSLVASIGLVVNDLGPADSTLEASCVLAGDWPNPGSSGNGGFWDNDISLSIVPVSTPS